MGITDDFIAIGTQLKIEKPSKGCVTTSCDSIEGPVVKFLNGSVKQIKTYEEAKEIYKEVEEIIYLGDMLFPFSDVINRNAQLIKPGYVEEWWALDLRKRNLELENSIKNSDVSFEKAIEISKKEGIPLYPKYIFYWTEITNEQLISLVDWLKHAKLDRKIILPYTKAEQEKFSSGKRALELLGLEHEVTIEHVVINKENSKALFANLGIALNLLDNGNLKEVFKEEDYILEKPVLEIVNSLSKFKIKDKAGTFIGTRMGRPEKAKLRKLTGSPNVLFPIGKEGGRLRSVQAAVEIGQVWSAFPIYHCEKCDKETIYSKCEDCGEETRQKYYFYNTKEKSFKKNLEGEERPGQPFCNQTIDIKHYFSKAVEKLGLIDSEIPPLIKGVRGTSSGDHIPENLAKGILRARRGLQVNKDGTIRFDVTELPLTSFKPKEISVDIDKLRKLGYTLDIYGKELVDENQILELMPHDILLPSSPFSPDERADDVFVKICNFVDDELERFYGMKAFYNVKKREDLVGKLGVCIAPHNCAGVICRFIGFSNVLGMLASPYMHAAVRRDCDGDEASLMLLGDVLLNFSRKFLPSHRGGTQDAPLVLNARINAGEVDDQILDFEYVMEYPLELYESAEKEKHSSEVKINLVRDILKKGADPFVGSGFTHDTSNFNEGVACSSYKTLPTMQEKVEHQMGLVEKIRAAKTAETAKLIINRHFLKDLRGNLRGFSQQKFRCVACNEIMRRPPLTGTCPRCKGKIIFTINEGGIKKYLESAISLAKQYNLSTYVQQNLELTKRFIESIFGRELEKQEKLSEWFG